MSDKINHKRLCDRIETLLSSVYADDAPGAVLMIADGDGVLFDRGYGLADMETKRPVDSNTNFNIGSISKQFTVAGILRLQELGLLSIEDAVAEYMPEFEGDIWKTVKIRHLMSHSSGVPDLRPRDDRQFTLHITDRQSLEYMYKLNTLKFIPGTAYDYVNPTFQILSAIIEKISGLDFEIFQRKCVFEPSGLSDIRYFSPQADIPNMAKGYIKDGVGAELSVESDSCKERERQTVTYPDSKGNQWVKCGYGEEPFFATKADGGIYTSASELLKWEQSLDECRCLSRESLELAYKKHTKVSGSQYCQYQNRPGTWYGLGWFIEDLPNRGLRIFHTGDNGGYQSYLAKYPGCGVRVVMLENRNDVNRWETQRQIEQMLREENVLPE